MKKIIAVSDSHGNIAGLKSLEPLFEKADYIFHTGDYFRDIRAFCPKYENKIYAVMGNCDGGGEEYVFEAEGIKILLVHGDRYHVKSGLKRLMAHAEELGVKAVFFGHTHRAEIIICNGITYINPGAMSRFGQKSYCAATIGNGEISAEIVKI